MADVFRRTIPIVCSLILESGVRPLALLSASIRPPFHGQERAVHRQPVQNGGGGGGIKHFVPLRRHEIGGHEGGFGFRPLGDHLEDGIGLILRGEGVADFVQAEHGNLGVELDDVIEVARPGDFRHQVEQGDEQGLMPLHDGIVAQGLRQVGFPDPGRPDQHQVARSFQPGVGQKLQQFVPGNLGIERPVEVLQGFDPFDSRAGQEVTDFFGLAQSGLLVEKPFEEDLFFKGEGVHVRQQSETAQHVGS